MNIGHLLISMEMDLEKLRTVSGIVTTLFKNFECPICLELMTSPYSTSCHHTFCRDCIYTVLKNKYKSVCPLCNACITKRSLHKNVQLVELLNAIKELPESVKLDTGFELAPEQPLVASVSASSLNDRQTNLEIFDFIHPPALKPSKSNNPSDFRRRSGRPRKRNVTVYEDEASCTLGAISSSTNINVRPGFPVRKKSLSMPTYSEGGHEVGGSDTRSRRLAECFESFPLHKKKVGRPAKMKKTDGEAVYMPHLEENSNPVQHDDTSDDLSATWIPELKRETDSRNYSKPKPKKARNSLDLKKKCDVMEKYPEHFEGVFGGIRTGRQKKIFRSRNDTSDTGEGTVNESETNVDAYTFISSQKSATATIIKKLKLKKPPTRKESTFEKRFDALSKKFQEKCGQRRRDTVLGSSVVCGNTFSNKENVWSKKPLADADFCTTKREIRDDSLFCTPSDGLRVTPTKQCSIALERLNKRHLSPISANASSSSRKKLSDGRKSETQFQDVKMQENVVTLVKAIEDAESFPLDFISNRKTRLDDKYLKSEPVVAEVTSTENDMKNVPDVVGFRIKASAVKARQRNINGKKVEKSCPLLIIEDFEDTASSDETPEKNAPDSKLRSPGEKLSETDKLKNNSVNVEVLSNKQPKKCAFVEALANTDFISSSADSTCNKVDVVNDACRSFLCSDSEDELIPFIFMDRNTIRNGMDVTEPDKDSRCTDEATSTNSLESKIVAVNEVVGEVGKSLGQMPYEELSKTVEKTHNGSVESAEACGDEKSATLEDDDFDIDDLEKYIQKSDRKTFALDVTTLEMEELSRKANTLEIIEEVCSSSNEVVGNGCQIKTEEGKDSECRENGKSEEDSSEMEFLECNSTMTVNENGNAANATPEQSNSQTSAVACSLKESSSIVKEELNENCDSLPCYQKSTTIFSQISDEPIKDTLGDKIVSFEVALKGESRKNFIDCSSDKLSFANGHELAPRASVGTLEAAALQSVTNTFLSAVKRQVVCPSCRCNLDVRFPNIKITFDPSTGSCSLDLKELCMVLSKESEQLPENGLFSQENPRGAQVSDTFSESACMTVTETLELDPQLQETVSQKFPEPDPFIESNPKESEEFEPAESTLDCAGANDLTDAGVHNMFQQSQICCNSDVGTAKEEEYVDDLMDCDIGSSFDELSSDADTKGAKEAGELCKENENGKDDSKVTSEDDTKSTKGRGELPVCRETEHTSDHRNGSEDRKVQDCQLSACDEDFSNFSEDDEIFCDVDTLTCKNKSDIYCSFSGDEVDEASLNKSLHSSLIAVTHTYENRDVDKIHSKPELKSSPTVHEKIDKERMAELLSFDGVDKNDPDYKFADSLIAPLKDLAAQQRKTENTCAAATRVEDKASPKRCDSGNGKTNAKTFKRIRLLSSSSSSSAESLVLNGAPTIIEIPSDDDDLDNAYLNSTQAMKKVIANVEQDLAIVVNEELASEHEDCEDGEFNLPSLHDGLGSSIAAPVQSTCVPQDTQYLLKMQMEVEQIKRKIKTIEDAIEKTSAEEQSKSPLKEPETFHGIEPNGDISAKASEEKFSGPDESQIDDYETVELRDSDDEMFSAPIPPTPPSRRGGYGAQPKYSTK